MSFISRDLWYHPDWTAVSPPALLSDGKSLGCSDYVRGRWLKILSTHWCHIALELLSPKTSPRSWQGGLDFGTPCTWRGQRRRNHKSEWSDYSNKFCWRKQVSPSLLCGNAWPEYVIRVGALSVPMSSVWSLCCTARKCQYIALQQTHSGWPCALCNGFDGPAACPAVTMKGLGC